MQLKNYFFNKNYKKFEIKKKTTNHIMCIFILYILIKKQKLKLIT